MSLSFYLKYPQLWLSGVHPFGLPLKPPPAAVFAEVSPKEHISEQKNGFAEFIIDGLKLQQSKLNFYMDVGSKVWACLELGYCAPWQSEISDDT